MPKNIEDIVIPEKKSIRDIPIPINRNKINIIDALTPRKSPGAFSYTPPVPSPRSNSPIQNNLGSLPGGRRYSKKSIWIGAIVAVVILAGILFSLLMTGATLTYVPKSTAITFNKDVYIAYKGDNQLLFSVMKFSGDKGVTTPASGEEQVSRKAQGTVVIYNNSSTKSQKLIKNTRFETPDGKIYRIASDVVVPGQKTVDGALVPGSLEVIVIADQAGDTYNIPLSDFTLPGLKGDSKFTTIYARSKTAITGGFIGTEKKISADDLAKTKTSLEASLRDELLAKARAQLPAGFILFPNLTNIVYEDLPQSEQTISGATVNERGNFYGVIFKEQDLVNYLTQKKSATESDRPITIAGISSLNLSFVGQPSLDLLNANQISFQVDGSVRVIFIVDEESLKKDLAGINKNDEESILSKYPGILSASAVVRPFWKNTFPTDSSKIKIVKNIQN